MKSPFHILLIVFLLLPFMLLAQKFEFETIHKRTPHPNWEIREIKGSITINDTAITIKTDYNTQVLTVISKQQFISADHLIYLCKDSSNNAVNIRLYCDDLLLKYYELFYYPTNKNDNYYRFCATRLKN